MIKKIIFGYVFGRKLDGLKIPEFESSDLKKGDLGDYFKEIKEFLANMKTKNSNDETAEAVVKEIETNKFKPRKNSPYEPLMVDVIQLLHAAEHNYSKQINALKLARKVMKSACNKLKDKDRKGKLQQLLKYMENISKSTAKAEEEKKKDKKKEKIGFEVELSEPEYFDEDGNKV